MKESLLGVTYANSSNKAAQPLQLLGYPRHMLTLCSRLYAFVVIKWVILCISISQKMFRKSVCVCVIGINERFKFDRVFWA